VEIRIRDYREGELDTLWRIDQKCFEPGISYSAEELEHYMGMRGAFTAVAEAREDSRGWQVVGFIVGQRHPRGMGHIITIDVLPNSQGIGVGSRLLQESEARLKTAGCRSIYLETAVDNETALQFYKRHGYYVLKTIPRYYLGRIDALLLGKKLE
jgi:ribosomal-protein-alanine N-acetyltransferase